MSDFRGWLKAGQRARKGQRYSSLLLSYLVVFFMGTTPAFGTDGPHTTNDINTLLMHCTFLLSGPAKESGKTSLGTVFFVAQRDPHRMISLSGGPEGTLQLVTANHVLDSIQSDEATLKFREQDADGNWVPILIPVQIRNHGTPLWTTHSDKSIDVAVLDLLKHVPVTYYPKIKKNIGIIECDRLADDEQIEKYELHPGEELMCLGFPLGAAANESGFPILRGGFIASYPLVPTRKMKKFLFDFQIFPGNSGGPVYFRKDNPNLGGNSMVLGRIQYIVGLLTQQVTRAADGKELVIGVVIPSSLINETLELALKNE